MVENLSAFLPIELKKSEFETICNSLGGFPSVLLNAKDSSTYNNIETLSKVFYVNILIPILTLIYGEISKGLELTKDNIWIEPDFSRIDFLKKSEKTELEIKQLKTNILISLFDKGILTKEQLLNKIRL
jgi:hypothetical protein